MKVKYKWNIETIHPKYGLLEPKKEYEIESNDLKNSALFEVIKKKEKMDINTYPKLRR